MKKLLSGIIILGLVFLPVAITGYFYAKSNDFFFSKINEQLEKNTGYVLEKDGALEFTLLPRLKLTARKLEINNPSNAMGAQLLKTERLSLELEWLSILRSDIVIDIEFDTTEIDLQVDKSGLANWSTSKLQSNSAGLPFKLGNIDARQTRFRFRNNQTQEILGLDLDQIDIDLENGQADAQVNTAGRYGNTRFLAQGGLKYDTKKMQLELNLGLRAGEAGDKKVATITVPSVSDWIEQNGASLPLNGKLKGSLSIKELLPHGSLNFDVEAQTIGDISYLGEDLKHLREEPGPIVASGVLQLNGSDLDIIELQAELHHQGQLNLEVNGTIQNLLSELQADLRVKGHVSRLDQVLASSPVTAIDLALLSRLEAVDFNAAINNYGPDIQVNDMGLHFSHRGFEASVAGTVEFTKASVLAKLKIDSKTEKVSDLLELLGIENTLPGDPGPFTLSAAISNEDNHYLIKKGTLNTLDGQIKATASGSLNVTDSGPNFDLNSSLNVKDFSLLAAILPDGLQPYLQGISGNASGNINGTMESFSIRDAEVALTHNSSTLHLEGRLSQLPDNLISDINVRYSAEKPIELEQYFPKLTGLQLTGPLELSGIVRTIDSKIFVQRIRLQAKQTDVEGEVIVDLGLSPPRISATLNSEQLITNLVENEPEVIAPEMEKPELDKAQQAELQAQEELSPKELGERFGAYTSSIAINTDWIDQLDIYFSYSAAKAQIGDYTADNLALIVNASEGIFKLIKYELMLDDKPISFSGLINANMNPPEYEFVGEVTGDTLETLLNIEGGLLEGGELSGTFELKSGGANIGQLIENLDGNALVIMGPLTIRSNALSFVSSSIFSAMVGGLMSKQEDEPASIYECGVLGIDINKGVARVNKAFAMQAKDYNLAGNGTIDLNTGAVDIRVNPKARKGLGLSISTIVGGFQIKGNMATPDFGVGGGSFISAVVAGYALAPVVAAGAATNPITASIVATGFLLTGIFDRMTASNYTCENTLKRIERNRSKAAAPPEPEIEY